VESAEEAIQIIRRKPQPLALYIFASDRWERREGGKEKGKEGGREGGREVSLREEGLTEKSLPSDSTTPHSHVGARSSLTPSLSPSLSATCDLVMQQVPSGGVCLNDTLVQFACTTLPFGGIGTSGLGQYHGR
jgi:hypothetical protein